MVTTEFPDHYWCLYHQAWDVIWNDTDELFLTSDNPSCFDYGYGDQCEPARYLPLSPRLALWTMVQSDRLPKVVQVSPRERFGWSAGNDKVCA